MQFVAIIPYLFAALLLVLGAFAVGAYLMIWVPLKWHREHGIVGQRKKFPAHRDSSWLEGSDLERYPERLRQLEIQLDESLTAVQSQVEHLNEHHHEVQAKLGREELVGRYMEDVELLNKRAEHMRRVLGLVWRTRSLLTVRAHLAVTARRRPNLDFGGLDAPSEVVPSEASEPAPVVRPAMEYREAADEVHDFVKLIRHRRAEIDEILPRAPRKARVMDSDEAMVEQEAVRIREAHRDLEERMDLLSDSLTYLADRQQTRQLVRGTQQHDGELGRIVDHAELGPGLEMAGGSAESMLDAVSKALEELDELTCAGDRHMADAAIDNLAEDISHLERAGLEAQAEADAALEISRLIDNFPSLNPS